MTIWRVPLPLGAEPPYRVFVNGVPQTEGEHYEVNGAVLEFSRELRKEGRIGFWRWTLMFFSIMGTYRRDDSIDVEYSHAGTRRLAVGLEIVQPEGGVGSGS